MAFSSIPQWFNQAMDSLYQPLLMWDKNKFLFEIISTHIILYGCEVLGYTISRKYWWKIEQIHKWFITYNLKIKSNVPYPILLVKVSLSPIEIIAMTRYLTYKHKISNMGNERLSKIDLSSSQNQLHLK